AREREREAVLLDPLRRIVGRIALHAGADACADRVDVGPGSQRAVAAIHLGRGEAGRVHRTDEVAFLAQHLARSAEVEQDRLVLVGDEDVRGLDVQVQHLVLMDDAQPSQYLVEQGTDRRFAKYFVTFQVARGDDEILQGISLQVIHDHVDGFVLAEEIENRNDARMRYLRERAAFFEEALQAEPVERLLLGLDAGRQLARRALGERRRQIFLERNELALAVLAQIDHAETTGRQFLDDLVAAHDRAGWQWRGF